MSSEHNFVTEVPDVNNRKPRGAVMSKGRLATLWQNIKKSSLIYKQTSVLVGVDKDGNKFYEKVAGKALRSW